MKCFNISDLEESVQGSPFSKLARVDNVFVTGKIDSHEQVDFLRDLGIKLAIDLKEPGENEFAEYQNLKMAGINYVNMPVGNVKDLDFDSAKAFGDLLDSTEGPILVYCMSGNRVGAMIALHLAMVCGHSKQKAIEVGERVGMVKENTKSIISETLGLKG